jgi:hypothetical protein
MSSSPFRFEINVASKMATIHVKNFKQSTGLALLALGAVILVEHWHHEKLHPSIPLQYYSLKYRGIPKILASSSRLCFQIDCRCSGHFDSNLTSSVGPWIAFSEVTSSQKYEVLCSKNISFCSKLIILQQVGLCSNNMSGHVMSSHCKH